jgi:hypothetical protein
MSKTVQIGSNIYTIPEEGDNPGWGEDLTAYLEAIADALANVQGPNDILITSANLNNNQTTFANVAGLQFNTAQVQAIEVKYLIIREYDAGATVVTESGTISGNYDGSTFFISTQHVGDAGITFDVTNTGQVQYQSSNLANHVTSVIRFQGKTIDEP